MSCSLVLRRHIPVICAATPGRAEPIRLQESFTAGGQYHVAIREEAAGELRLPAEGDKPAPPPLKVRGRGALRSTTNASSTPARPTIPPRGRSRIYRRVELERTVDDQAQEIDVAARPSAGSSYSETDTARSPFSPDGPMTWAEVHLVSKDVFTPALAAGLLPDRPGVAGRPLASQARAAQELTDLEQIEGGLECRFVEVTTLGRPAAGPRHVQWDRSRRQRGRPEPTAARRVLLLRPGILPFELPILERRAFALG